MRWRLHWLGQAGRAADRPQAAQPLVRFGRRGVEQLVADHLDHGLTYTEIAKKYDVALSTVSKYIQQAKRQRAEELT